ncbi:hypothetical protein DSO57_1037462 [Entomophthora muscae]|uniref:Uncharacterized protein n=1 Tax=Entomophthora muscae TaxID=34485 RepID=A0ACC2U8S3_9FUNG|nr:hypothetical protein DSO57_1037462 [Entomophthora muscae]
MKRDGEFPAPLGNINQEPTSDSHNFCLYHKAYTDRKNDLWETIESVQDLICLLYKDLEAFHKRVTQLEEGHKKAKKRHDLLTSTVLMMEENHSNLLEQLVQERAVIKIRDNKKLSLCGGESPTRSS